MTYLLDLAGVRGGMQLQQRPATPDDLLPVVELLADCNRRDTGEQMVEEDDIVGDWQRPSFDLASESVAVLEGDRLVAYADVFGGHRVEAYVHPDARGRGIGSALVRWSWEVAKRRGSTRVAQPVPEASDSATLLAANGYVRTHTAWLFDLPPDAEMTSAPLPPGVRLREFALGTDDHETYDVIENAFSEWTDREATPFADWAARSTELPGFEPWRLQLAVDESADSHQIVGVVHVLPTFDDAWVGELAVRSDRRGQGLGRALLVHAREVARTHLGAGISLGLATDTRTGKRDLYEHVGMQVKHTFVHYEKEL